MEADDPPTHDGDGGTGGVGTVPTFAPTSQEDPDPGGDGGSSGVGTPPSLFPISERDPGGDGGSSGVGTVPTVIPISEHDPEVGGDGGTQGVGTPPSLIPVNEDDPQVGGDGGNQGVGTAPSVRPIVRAGQSAFLSLALLGLLLPATPLESAPTQAPTTETAVNLPCASSTHGSPGHAHDTLGLDVAVPLAAQPHLAGIPWWTRLWRWLTDYQNTACPDCNLGPDDCDCVCGSGGDC
ncbi:MAG: hypothetical protein SangKO_099120 [Sandaracinaceae bacterium]